MKTKLFNIGLCLSILFTLFSGTVCATDISAMTGRLRYDLAHINTSGKQVRVLADRIDLSKAGNKLGYLASAKKLISALCREYKISDNVLKSTGKDLNAFINECCSFEAGDDELAPISVYAVHKIQAIGQMLNFVFNNKTPGECDTQTWYGMVQDILCEMTNSKELHAGLGLQIEIEETIDRLLKIEAIPTHYRGYELPPLLFFVKCVNESLEECGAFALLLEGVNLEDIYPERLENTGEFDVSSGEAASLLSHLCECVRRFKLTRSYLLLAASIADVIPLSASAFCAHEIKERIGALVTQAVAREIGDSSLLETEVHTQSALAALYKKAVRTEEGLNFFNGVSFDTGGLKEDKAREQALKNFRVWANDQDSREKEAAALTSLKYFIAHMVDRKGRGLLRGELKSYVAMYNRNSEGETASYAEVKKVLGKLIPDAPFLHAPLPQVKKRQGGLSALLTAGGSSAGAGDFEDESDGSSDSD